MKHKIDIMKPLSIGLTLLFLVMVFFLVSKDTHGGWEKDEQRFEFPLCEDMTEDGDHAHYDYGEHQIAGADRLWGSDDVYNLGDGHYLQCFCDVEGNGIQTNWWQAIEGQEWGVQWNLGEYWYNYENSVYECSKPTPTPTIPPPNPPHNPLPPISPDPPTAPQCTNMAPLLECDNLHIIRDGDEATIKCEPSDDAPTANVYWRLRTSTEWEHALGDIKNTGYVEINGLGTRDWTFGYQQANGCAGRSIQVVIDANVPTIFKWEGLWE